MFALGAIGVMTRRNGIVVFMCIELMLNAANLVEIGNDVFAEVKAAFHEHLVVVFPDQHLTPDQQIAFTARFGPVEEHPLRTRPGMAEHPEILVLMNKPGERAPRNDRWHSDISYTERPPLGSVLYGLQVPEGRGDTMFCNMAKAFTDLSPAMQEMLRPLSALHSAAPVAARNNAGGTNANKITEVPAPVAHPVVRSHPDTGRHGGPHRRLEDR